MRRSYSFAAALMAASSMCPPALAEADELIVTATRAETAQSDLPAAVVVIDADRARARGQLTLDQALAEVPGLEAPRAGPIGQQSSIFSGGFESNHTLVLFDGVRLDDPSTPEGVFDAGQDLIGDAGRIEVVQGPMSALYGSQALGGVINILPRRGGEGALNPRFESAFGSFDTLSASLGADGSVGRFRYALNAEAFSSNGYDVVPERMAVHTGERDGADITTLTGTFDYELSRTLSLDLLLRRRDAQVEYDPGFFGDIGENPFAEIASESALWRLGARWSLAPSASLRVSGGALETDRVSTDAGAPGDGFSGLRRFAELGAAWRVGPWAFTSGAVLEREKIDALSFGAPISGAQQHWGVFAGAQGTFGPLNVTAAARHDDHEGFGAKTTWRAGAAYDIGANMRVYGAYGSGFRAPSLYERFAPFFGAAGLKPESASSWELGADARLELFGREDGLELGALHRHSQIDNLIGFFGFSYANIDAADIDYSAARLTLRPLGWLSARLVYANTNARDAGDGQPLARRPRHGWSAELNLERAPFAAQLAWREVGARIDTVYDDGGAWAGLGRVDAYDLLRASASWTLTPSLLVYIAADNALDQSYEPVNGFQGAPRSVLVGVRVRP